VRHVQLDAVVTAAPRPLGRGPVLRDDGPDLVEREVGGLLPPARARDLEEVDDLRDDRTRRA
jgi:hypothetical protein